MKNGRKIGKKLVENPLKRRPIFLGMCFAFGYVWLLIFWGGGGEDCFACLPRSLSASALNIWYWFVSVFPNQRKFGRKLPSSREAQSNFRVTETREVQSKS